MGHFVLSFDLTKTSYKPRFRPMKKIYIKIIFDMNLVMKKVYMKKYLKSLYHK